MFHLPTDVIHEILLHLLRTSQDLMRLEVAFGSDKSIMHQLYTQIYPQLGTRCNLKHSQRGLDEKEMAWFFKRRIPLTSISFSHCCNCLNVSAILNMLHNGGYAQAVKHIEMPSCQSNMPEATIFGEQILKSLTGLESFDGKHCGKLINDEFVTRLAQQCSGLTTLKIAGYSKFSDKIFHALGKGCQSLTYLDVSTCMRGTISETAMIALTEGCPILSTLYLEGASFEHAAVVAMAQNGQSLTSLNLRESNINDAMLGELVQGCSKLSALMLSDCDIVDSDASIIALARGFSSLTYLQLNSFYSITDASVIALAQECKLLTNLDLSYCPITDDAVTALIDHCPQLVELNINYCDITDASILSIANGGLSNLKRLYFAAYEDMDNDEVAIISPEALNELEQKRPSLMLY